MRTKGTQTRPIKARRLDALEKARLTGGRVKVPGANEYVEVKIDNGLRYSILIRACADGNRAYNLMCPKNGRILGPRCTSQRGVISSWKRTHRKTI